MLLSGTAMLGAAAASAAPGASAAKDSGFRYAIGKASCAKPALPNRVRCHAMRRVFVSKGTPGAHRVPVRAVPNPGPAGGLTPAELASAYGYSTAGGVGVTVGIVDAYNDPNIEADLATFSSKYGLPTCTKANGCLRVVSQTGSTTVLPPNDTTGWSSEEALDVEVVHAVCPHCKILLVETTSNSYANMATGMPHYAMAKGVTVVQVHGVGPFVVDYINPADDPSKK